MYSQREIKGTDAGWEEHPSSIQKGPGITVITLARSCSNRLYKVALTFQYFIQYLRYNKSCGSSTDLIVLA